jgi:hypothetical protein
MWCGYTTALKVYINSHIRVWSEKYKNTMKIYDVSNLELVQPWWRFSDAVVYSHRAALFRKEPESYPKFDVQNEYQDFNPAPHLDRKQFISECIEFTDTFCVFEEATGFFKGRLDEQTDRMILSARHTRNRYIFCFHSIQAVPPGIMNMVNLYNI